MKTILILIILLILPTYQIYGAEQCITVDMDGWTQTMKNHLKMNAYHLTHAAGDPKAPTRWSNQTGEICYEDPQVDIASILTTATLVSREADRIQEENIASTQKSIKNKQKIDTLRNKLKTNKGLTDTDIELLFNFRED